MTTYGKVSIINIMRKAARKRSCGLLKILKEKM